MGKSPKPLQIWVDDSLTPYGREKLDELAAQGHLIVYGDGIRDYCTADFDLMIGPQCWRMNDGLFKNLDLAIKGSRTLRYPGKSKPNPGV